MRVLLKGIGGVYNYGCEAIVRGTVNILRDLYPQIQIDYASYRIENDTKRLQHCDINIIPVHKTWSLKHIFRGILNRLKINNKIFLEDYSEINKYDAVFSIGGDIYTIYPGDLYAESLVKYGEECYKRNVPYILWGCSVGPFDKCPRILNIFKKHLSHIPLIVARENVTIDYLKSIGIDKNVCFSFDPAFFVQPDNRVVSVSDNLIHRVGINLSPAALLFQGIEQEKIIGIHVETIQTIIDYYQCDVVLLPHVVDTIDIDNDFVYLSKLYMNLGSKYKSRVQLISNDPGFLGIKEQIKQCDLVISARMHCCINSIACGVPTIFLSYSDKSKGMCRLVYGSEKNCVPVSEFCPDKIISIINNSDRVCLKKTNVLDDNARKKILNTVIRK